MRFSIQDKKMFAVLMVVLPLALFMLTWFLNAPEVTVPAATGWATKTSMSGAFTYCWLENCLMDWSAVIIGVVSIVIGGMWMRKLHKEED